jgi:hypothetical protein
MEVTGSVPYLSLADEGIKDTRAYAITAHPIVVVHRPRRAPLVGLPVGPALSCDALKCHSNSSAAHMQAAGDLFVAVPIGREQHDEPVALVPADELFLPWHAPSVDPAGKGGPQSEATEGCGAHAKYLAPNA